MNRRDFLKLIGTAATLAVIAKPLSVVQTVTPPELLLRPSYLAWLNETEFHSLVWMVTRKATSRQNPTITATPGSWAGEEIPTIELCLQKVDLPRDRKQRLETLLELQAMHPWPQDDWEREMARARTSRDDTLLAELHDAYKKESGILPRVYPPSIFRKDEERRAEVAQRATPVTGEALT